MKKITALLALATFFLALIFYKMFLNYSENKPEVMTYNKEIIPSINHAEKVMKVKKIVMLPAYKRIRENQEKNIIKEVFKDLENFKEDCSRAIRELKEVDISQSRGDIYFNDQISKYLQRMHKNFIYNNFRKYKKAFEVSKQNTELKELWIHETGHKEQCSEFDMMKLLEKFASSKLNKNNQLLFTDIVFSIAESSTSLVQIIVNLKILDDLDLSILKGKSKDIKDIIKEIQVKIEGMKALQIKDPNDLNEVYEIVSKEQKFMFKIQEKISRLRI